MNVFLYIREFLRGKDLYRTLMNNECVQHTINGNILDIGSGRELASYHRFLKYGSDSVVESLDLMFARDTGKQINLEKDFLSFADASVDTVLLFNVLEHVYNFSHLLGEVKRVLKPGGKVIGAVPFLVAYHPDPHDYWRFTTEALEKIFESAGFINVRIKAMGCGPYGAAFSQIEPTLPRLFKIFCLPVVKFFDFVIIKLRPKMNKDKFCLGFYFTLTK